MATSKTKEFESALKTKGFKRDNTHHHMYWYYASGKKTSLRTRASNGEKEFDDSLASQRRKQMGGISRKQFQDFISCSFTKEQFLQHLLDTGEVRMQANRLPKDPPSRE